MGIADLFRPKHRHSDAAVRADAVRRLGVDEADLLARIARDDHDEAVRRIAIDKLDDPSLLVDIAGDEADRALQKHARARAAEIWITQAVTGAEVAEGHAAIDGLLELGDQRALAEIAGRATFEEVREAALAVITDAKALAEVVRVAPSPQMRKAAIEQIADPDVLRSVAVDDARKDVALAALDRLPVDDGLEVVAAKAKSKAVRARARKKLSERAAAAATAGDEADDPAAAEDKRRHAERVQLVRRAEKLAKKHEWVRSFEELHELEQRWAAVGAGGDGREARALADRFREACERYRARRQRYAAASEKKAAAEAMAAKEKAAEADADGDDRGAQAAPAGADGDGGGAEARQAEADAASEGAAADEEADGAAAGEAAGARDAQDAQDAARDRERRRQERREDSLAELTRLCERLETALAGDVHKALDRALQAGQKAFEGLKHLSDGDEPVKRYHAARQAAVIKLQELREADDWKRWANVPRLESLVIRAQELLASEDASKLGARLKALQAEWKEVGPAPHKRSNELWQAFKTTCDQIYERVKQHRASAHLEQQHNLERKQALCEQVEALSTSTEWDETADRIKALQREWKAIGPVPRKKSDALWKRFRSACDAFFERRKPYIEGLMAERERCLEQKQALCERAEALAESTDWQETASALRDLQREWKEIGPVPRKDANAINKRFRSACDRFFERREAARTAEREARDRQLREVREEIERLLRGEPAAEGRPGGEAGEVDAATVEGDAAAEGDTQAGGDDAAAGGDAATGEVAETATPDAPASPPERALAVRAALRGLMPLDPAVVAEVLARAGEMYRAILDGDPEAFRGTELDPRTSRTKKLKLCARVEEIAPAPQSAAIDADAGSPQDVAEKLRAALAQNAMASALAATTDARGIADAIASLESSWRWLGPVPGPEGEALELRFESACERARRSAGIAD